MLLNARQIERDVGNEKIILLAIEDITERRLAEELLSEKNRMTSEYLDILLNYAHAPIIIWDSSLVIKRFNREFEKLSGYSSSEVIDEKIEILFPKEKIDFIMELLQHHLKKETIEVVELDILTKNKEIKTVLWNSKNILEEKEKILLQRLHRILRGANNWKMPFAKVRSNRGLFLKQSPAGL